MKKTVNANIGGTPFVVDEDAYTMLQRYLSEIEIRLDGVDDKETMQDIETRIADIFNGTISARVQVVDVQLVKRAIAIIGSAREFGEPKRSLPENETHSGNSARRLYRSRHERIVGGVCGGIAEYSELDLTLVRVLMALFIIFGGAGLIVYLVMWIIIPNEPRQRETSNEGRRK